MILFNYYNEDGYITQIVNYVTNTLDELGLNFRMAFREEVFEKAKKYQPEIILAYHPPYDFDKYLDRFKEISCHKVLWESESPFEIDITRRALDVFYYAFIMDKKTTEVLEKDFGKERIIHVPCAFYPEVHKHYKTNWSYKSDLVFVGAPFKSRLKFFEENKEFLNHFNVTIIGFGWKGQIDLPPNFRVINDIISDKECMKYYSNSKVSLNLHRQNSDSFGHNELGIEASSPANRLFEIAGTKSAQIVDDTRSPEIFDYFKDGITVFKNNDDFRKKFTELISDYSLREKLAKEAYDIAIKNHTYKHRIEKYLMHLLK